MTNDQLIEIYRLMIMGRLLETTMAANVKGFHEGSGEEAVMVGSFYCLGKDDVLAPHFRGMVTASYLRGVDLKKLIGGMLNKDIGFTRGRWRVDICGDPSLNIFGMWSGNLGSNIGLATGTAFADMMKKNGRVSVTTFGDGTSNQGIFHEAINMAACYKLPVVYVCQNNQWAITMRAENSIKCGSVAERAKGYGIPGVQVDGNDVLAVHQAVSQAVDRARKGEGPSLIEAKTYRVVGHYNLDQAAYQPSSEVARWKEEKDPIKLLKEKLINDGVINSEAAAEIKSACQVELAAVMAAVENEPEPDVAVLDVNDVFAPDQTMEDRV